MVEEVEVENDDVVWGKKLHVRVHLDLTKPLARGRKIPFMGKNFWIHIHYEKFLICFSCRCIVHESGKCRGSNKLSGGDNQFGIWFQVPTEGKRMMNDSQYN